MIDDAKLGMTGNISKLKRYNYSPQINLYAFKWYTIFYLPYF